MYLDKVSPAQGFLYLPELEAFGLGAAAPGRLSERLPVRPAPPAARRRLHRLSATCQKSRVLISLTPENLQSLSNNKNFN